LVKTFAFESVFCGVQHLATAWSLRPPSWWKIPLPHVSSVSQ
jgi:hypothetical protein